MSDYENVNMKPDYENVKGDYTPTTQEVRDVWGKHSRYMEFDDWLASVKAEAWDEGVVWLMTEQGIPFAHLADELHANPYRSEQ